ncbi:MAG TPA: riboflavin synthase [Thermoanaerobaculia bacterium]|nr:riboflavin synthase [Thermoanaerobaculia bacterium]
MFTGLIQECGQILGEPRPSGLGGVRLVIAVSPRLAAELGAGASLAVAGVCLTIVERAEAAVNVELAPETLARTTLGGLRSGAAVNIEPPLRAGDPLGGHLVQGHVDGTTVVVARRDLAEHRVLAFSLPEALAPYLVEKGSVSVDGVSLTVAALAPDRFEVALLPHTLAVTTLGALVPGDAVNLEVDVLAKYVHRMLAARGLVPESESAAAAAPPPAEPPPAAAPAGAGPSR